MHVVAVVLARFNSSRLPGKALMDLNGTPMLQKCLENLKASKLINETVVATSVEQADDIIASFSKNLDYKTFRGSLEDVLGRFCMAAESRNAEVVVYVGGDSPLMDIPALDEAIQLLIQENLDFVSNYEFPTFPNGHDINVISINALRKVNELAELNFERTNIFSFITFNSDKFKTKRVTCEINNSEYQLAVDTPEDYNHICKIIEILDYKGIKIYDFRTLKSVAQDDETFFNILESQNKIPKANHSLFSSKKILDEIIQELAEILLKQLSQQKIEKNKLMKAIAVLKVLNESI